MKIAIGKRAYRATSAFVTLLRYVAEFGESYMETFFDGKSGAALPMARLVWCSITDNDKPDFFDFLELAAKSGEDFSKTALIVQSRVLASPLRKSPESPQGDDGTVNETTILALMAVCGIDFSLANELPVFYISDVISERNRMMSQSVSGVKQTKAYRKFTQKDMANLYGGGAR